MQLGMGTWGKNDQHCCLPTEKPSPGTAKEQLDPRQGRVKGILFAVGHRTPHRDKQQGAQGYRARSLLARQDEQLGIYCKIHLGSTERQRLGSWSGPSLPVMPRGEQLMATAGMIHLFSLNSSAVPRLGPHRRTLLICGLLSRDCPQF